MSNKVPSSVRPAEAEFQHMLAEAVRRLGWRVSRPSWPGNQEIDLLFSKDDQLYIVEIKRSSEGRRDRLIPLLSQAILQAQARARNYREPGLPVAVVAAPRIPESVAEEIKRFASSYAPGMAIGVMDNEGFRAFSGQGLEALDAQRRNQRRLISSPRAPASRLFSDLNQWMIKVLLANKLPESLLSAPRESHRNISQLARAADVSVMSAYRFIKDMAREGFIEEHRLGFRIVRIEALFERWVAANQGAVREYPARWILRSGKDQSSVSIRSYLSPSDPSSKGKPRAKLASPLPRICLGLFAAADLLRMGFVHGIPPHIYLENIDDDVLQKLGISLLDAEGRPDIYLRLPEFPESVFRGAINKDGVLISDILQIWLDVSSFPARGKAQADEIRKKVLKPLFAGDRN